MIHSNGRYPRWLLVILVAIALVAGGQYARAQGSPRITGAVSGGTSAFVLTISGRPLGVVSIPVSDIREAASTQLAATLSQRGSTVMPQETTLSLMRKWRVRDGESISRGFLESLADSLDVRLLLVVTLFVQRDGLIATARYLDTGSAIVLNVCLTEWGIGPLGDENSTKWLEGARTASAIVANAPIAMSPPGGEPALILDTEPVGCSADIGLVASHALVEYYLEHGDRPLIDPAVTTAALRNTGFSERYLGADTRALLRSTFGCRALIVPRLISYAPARRTAGQIAEYDEFPDDGAPLATDFAMSLRLIDLDTGSIAAGKEVFLPVPESTGWFGVPRDETLAQRLKITASHLWPDINNALEEF